MLARCVCELLCVCCLKSCVVLVCVCLIVSVIHCGELYDVFTCCVCVFFLGGLLLRIYVVVMFVVYCVRLDVLLLCCVLRVCACLCVCVCVFVCDLLCDALVSYM